MPPLPDMCMQYVILLCCLFGFFFPLSFLILEPQQQVSKEIDMSCLGWQNTFFEEGDYCVNWHFLKLVSHQAVLRGKAQSSLQCPLVTSQVLGTHKFKTVAIPLPSVTYNFQSRNSKEANLSNNQNPRANPSQHESRLRKKLEKSI